ncbi:ChbG/HpnK family deacetylase [Telmatospirillum siberiense]|nr:ChbG/HpnK family deacetylase [Telmatospirillum siberiense]
MILHSGQPRQLVICADDYAISPAVSAGIRELAVAGRLSATGVMSCMPAWADEAPALRPLGAAIAVGLHVTLTDQRPLGAMPRLAPDGRLPGIGRLFKLSFGFGLPKEEVAAELERQLDAFEANFGRSPDFIDGHQHVHLLPGVRQAILALFERRLDARHVWLRDCTDRPSAILKRGGAFKAGVIAAVGRPLSKAARARKIAMNRGFSGFYDIRRQSLGAVLEGMLADAGDGHLLMVHPGHVDEALRACDSLTDPRQSEWETLMAPDLPGRLAAQGFAIASGDACP